MAINRETTLRWMQLFAEQIDQHRQELVMLDTAIGDGDHGTNMDRGMKKVIEKLGADGGDGPADPAAVLKLVAMTLISTVGGAAGPLYGTLFLKLSGGFSGAEIDLPTYVAAWQQATEGVQARGKAQAEDKTMVDALLPAVAAMAQSAELDDALQAATAAAQQGMLATTPLVARKGRASYLGERSAGHQDPGATSTYYLFASAQAAFTG